MDSFVFTPSTACSVCNHIIHLDPNSTTGASPTRPCELWAEPQAHGFKLCAKNLGSCKVFIYVKRFGDADFPLASFPVTLTGPDGNAVIGTNGKPVTAIPYEPFAIFDSFTEVNILEKLTLELFVTIGVLCVKSHPSVCPICDVEFSLELSCGETLFYKISSPIVTNGVIGTPLSINGTVQCDDDEDTINVTNLRAQLVTCPCCKGCPSRIVDTVPIIANDMTPNQGTYEFKNVLVDCFRVVIICTSLSASGSTVPTGTGNRVLGASECQLAGGVIGSRMIMVDPITIDCTICIPPTVTVTGTAVCSTGTITNVTVQFIRCVRNADAKCGQSGAVACGSPLLVDPTFSMVLPADGKFTATIPEDCYLVRFVCTSSPSTVLVTTPVQTCTFFCRPTTNLGTISIVCACTSPQISLSGSIICSPTTTFADGITAALFPTTVNTPLSSIIGLDISNATVTSTVNSLGSFNFGAVDAGHYAVRIICTSCDDTGTDVGGTASILYSSNTVLSPISINCSACNTAMVSGGVMCTSGVPSSVQVRIYNYASSSSSSANTINLITPNASTGEYSLCVPRGIQIAFEVICLSTGAVLQSLTSRQTVENNINRSFTFDCTCA